MPTFHVPRRLLVATTDALRKDVGERTVLWQVAEPPDELMTVRQLVTPAQEAIVTPTGHLVHVAGAELARIQLEAYRMGMRTWVQLHTHPGRNVQMSETDRAWAIADFPGALSLIVPHFAKDGLVGWPGVAVHERQEDGWRKWASDEVEKYLVVE